MEEMPTRDFMAAAAGVAAATTAALMGPKTAHARDLSFMNDLPDPMVAESKPWFPNIVSGSSGTTENFIRIGHSLLVVVVALFGGQLSRYLDTKNPQETSRPLPAPVSISNDSEV